MFCFRLWFFFSFFLSLYALFFIVILCNNNIFLLCLQMKNTHYFELISDWSRAAHSSHFGCRQSEWFMWNYNYQCISPKADCLSVCQSVSLTCGLMYWSVLFVYRSVFQSVSPFVGERFITRGQMPLNTSGFNQYGSLKSFWRYFWTEVADSLCFVLTCNVFGFKNSHAKNK